MQGLTLGPITGKLMAEYIVDGTPALDIQALRPDRFGTDWLWLTGTRRQSVDRSHGVIGEYSFGGCVGTRVLPPDGVTFGLLTVDRLDQPLARRSHHGLQPRMTL